MPLKKQRTLEERQTAVRFSAAERKVRRKALVAERREARDAKQLFRHQQQMYLNRKKAHKHLLKKEREAYLQSYKEFCELCAELVNVKDRLRGARLSYEESLPSEVKLALRYADGWRDSREALLREQAEARDIRNGT